MAIEGQKIKIKQMLAIIKHIPPFPTTVRKNEQETCDIQAIQVETLNKIHINIRMHKNRLKEGLFQNNQTQTSISKQKHIKNKK